MRLVHLIMQVQYCTACRLVTARAVLGGRLEVVAAGGRPWCLHFAGEPMPEDAASENGKEQLKVKHSTGRAVWGGARLGHASVLRASSIHTSYTWYKVRMLALGQIPLN